MRLKFLGVPRRDGTYPTLVIENETVTIEDGYAEVREGLVSALLKTNNFGFEGSVIDAMAAQIVAGSGADPETPPAPEIPAAPGVSVAQLIDSAPAANDSLTTQEGAAAPEAAPAAPAAPEAAPEAAPAVPAADPAVSNEDAEKDALIAEARALGIRATRNWGIDKLKADIAAAKKATGA